VEEARHNRIEGAIGYSGVRQSLSGFIDLELGNLFGGGRRLAARWERIREDQSRLGLEWREPLLGPLPVGAQVRRRRVRIQSIARACRSRAGGR